MVWWDLGPRIQIEYVCYFPLEQYHNVCFFLSTPSYVSFNATERLVGQAATNQCARNPENTVFDAKRLIGRK